jgi:cytidine deaminase
MPLEPEPDALLALARDAASRAYAPYSGVRVGAAVRSRAGQVYVGCNVENAAYPLGVCAETSAIASGVQVEGGAFRVVEVAVWGETDAMSPLVISPCGGCRQRIREFAPDGAVPVHFLAATDSWVVMSIDELLPQPFLRGSRAAR